MLRYSHVLTDIWSSSLQTEKSSCHWRQLFDLVCALMQISKWQRGREGGTEGGEGGREGRERETNNLFSGIRLDHIGYHSGQRVYPEQHRSSHHLQAVSSSSPLFFFFNLLPVSPLLKDEQINEGVSERMNFRGHTYIEIMWFTSTRR